MSGDQIAARAVQAADEARARDLLPVTPDAYAAVARYVGPLLLDLAIDDASDPAARMAALLAVFRAERRRLPGSIPVHFEGQSFGVLYLDEAPTA